MVAKAGLGCRWRIVNERVLRWGYSCARAKLLIIWTLANPALASAFPSHHGLVQIQRLPSVATFVAPSDRLSTLRGLQHTGENNLAFRCTRKKLVFETLHLDIEGGTGARRTTAAATTTTGDIEDVVKKPAKKRVVFEDVF